VEEEEEADDTMIVVVVIDTIVAVVVTVGTAMTIDAVVIVTMTDVVIEEVEIVATTTGEILAGGRGLLHDEEVQDAKYSNYNIQDDKERGCSRKIILLNQSAA